MPIRARFVIHLILVSLLAGCGGSDTVADPTTTTASVVSTTTTTTAATTTTTGAGADPDAPFVEEFGAEPAAPWAWVNEDPERWEITQEGLRLTAGPRGIGPGSTEILGTNVLLRPTPDAGTGRDFAIQARLVVEPAIDFEQAGVFLLVDGDSYVSLVAGYCEPCGIGRAVFLETPNDGANFLEGFHALEIPPDVTTMTLRLEMSPDAAATVALVSFGVDGDWQRVGEIVRGAGPFTGMGIQAANLRGPESGERDLVAVFESVQVDVYG